MKVIILSFYSGLMDRGVETWAGSVKKNLGKDFEITIIGGEKYGNKISWENKSWLYWSLLVLKHAVTTSKTWVKADVVIPANGGLQVLFCRLVLWLKGKPMVVFGHAGLGADDKWNLLCSPNVFVAFSDRQLNWAKKYKLPWTRLIKISHAVDMKIFKPAIKPRKKIVLCVAADGRLKNVNLVREAVARLKGYKYIGVGKGNDKDVPHEKIPGLYREADVFCFVPKPEEAFGLVYLEALASNLPVVASDDPVRREIVGNAGVYVKNPENIRLLANNIKKCYETDWGKKPLSQAEKFSWHIMRNKYLELFNNLR